jgi:putative phosphoesterase
MKPMRIALVADTHGHLDPRVATVVRSCDMALHGGDIGNASVLDQLQPRGGRVFAVRGNNDLARRWPEEQAALLGGIPLQAHIELPGGELVLLHGHRQPARNRHQRLRARHPHARAICYGHSHVIADDRDTVPWVLNPGAAGRARTFGGPSCMVLIATESFWEVETHRFTLSRQRRRGNHGMAAVPSQYRPAGTA